MLGLQNISKSFPGVRALHDVTLEFKAGKVHAVCGENGAGKSTLMNILMGNLQPDEGKISWKGQTIKVRDVLFAQSLGIAIVYQERTLAEPLSIAENIFPVNLPLNKSGLIDYETLYEKTQKLLQELGLSTLSPKTIVSRLSVPQQQMVEIAKAIAQQPVLLILDEPTASLTHSETAILFRIMRELKDKGVAIIYISHRMAEIQEIADVISVLKDGIYVGTVAGNTPPGEVVRMMVGRDLEEVTQTAHVQKEIKLQVKNISGKGFQHISFDLYKGDILGFAGLQAAGRTAMAKAMFGDEAIYEGTVMKDGKKMSPSHPGEAMRNGLVYIPEDRKAEGLFLERSVAENIFSAQLQHGFYNETEANNRSTALSKEFNIRTPTVKKTVRQLSGGNQQKVVLAKWLALEPEVLIVNEPTNGVDIVAKAEIYQLLKKLTKEGKSVLLISSELPELLLLSDRIAVMHEGKIKTILKRQEATEERIASLASGIETI